MKRPIALLVAVLLALVLPAGAPALAAPDRPPAPVDRLAAGLSVPVADLRASVECTPSAYGSSREVALFVPGTGVGPVEAYSWNWFPALDEIDYPYCSVRLPDSSVGDIQVSAEYVVHAIRYTRAISQGKIAVIGASQGGVSPRFALRFWPDTRAMVADYVGLAAVNHGSTQNDILYPQGNGPAFGLQLKTTSRFIEALNSRQETFPGISYTSLSTTHDQFVTPNGSTDLRGPAGRVTNLALQDLCPADESDHIAIGTVDPVAYAVAMYAITHRGPAVPAAVPPSVCDEDLMPGVDPLTYESDLAEFVRISSENIANAPILPTEPALSVTVDPRGSSAHR